MTNNIAFRLQPHGGDDVVREAKRAEEALVGGQARGAAATQAAVAATDRQIAKMKELAAQATASARAGEGVQARIDRVTGVAAGGGENTARRSALALYAADEAYEARARRLRAAIDPLGAAQDRLNDELKEAKDLYRVGAIGAKDMAQAQVMARQRFDETTAALSRQRGGLTRLQAASRLNLARQGADVLTTAAMGMNPGMIAIQQGPQILDAMATSGIRVTATMVGLGVAMGAVAGGAVALALAWKGGENAALAYERTLTGLGRVSGLTSQELEFLTLTAAEQGRVTVTAAREQMSAYLSTGRIGGEVAKRLVTMGKDVASVWGVDMPDATKMLAQMMMEPDKAARELTRGGLGLLDQKTIDLIDSLVEAGDLLAAQKLLLDNLGPAISGHASRVGEIESAWDGVARSAKNAWEWLGRALHTTRDERVKQAQFRLAIAASPLARRQAERELYTATYLRDWEALDQRERSRTAAENQAAQLESDRRADAKRRGSTGGGGGGGQTADQARREALQRVRREEDIEHARDMQIAQALLDHGRMAALADEERVRTRVRQLEDDGVAAEKARTQAIEEQAALRDALGQQMSREAKGLIDAASIEADRAEGLDRFAEATERRLEFERRILAYAQVYKDLQTATSAAKLDQQMVDEARARAMERIVAAAQAEHQLDLARARGDWRGAAGMERDAWIERRAREIEQRGRDGRALNRGEGDEQAAREYAELYSAEMAGARREWMRGFIGDLRRGGVADALGNQLERAGDRFIDSLVESFFAINWSSAFGGKGGAMMDWITRGAGFLLGGRGGKAAPVGKNAAGTDFWPGGLTWVGELGPELLDLPRGSKVIEADRSRQMVMAAARQRQVGGGSFVFAPQIDARGAGPREIDRLEAKLDQLAAEIPQMALTAQAEGDGRRYRRAGGGVF